MTSVTPFFKFFFFYYEAQRRGRGTRDGRSSDLLVTNSIKAIQNFVWVNNLTLERINFIYLYC